MSNHYYPSEEEIKRIEFLIPSKELILKLSKAKITVPDTYDESGYPVEGGLMDLRLGVVDPGLKCKTCGGNHKTCPGHFGHIELVKPVVHPHFAKHINFVLVNTCEHCHRDLGVPALKKKATTKGRPEKCPHCGKPLGKIKWEKPYKFFLNNDELTPEQIRDWLKDIPEEDVKALGYNPLKVKLEDFLITYLLVPPVRIRPSITLESGEKSEDDLTHKLVEIIRVNEKLRTNIDAGAPQLIIEDLWSLLQYHVATYFDNELPNVPPARHRSGRPLKTLAQRLKGKEGRFRYNLSGKRVNFSARTVISPDPTLDFNEVGVPRRIAEEQTVPFPVTEFNLEQAKELVARTEYPRALYAIKPNGLRLKVTERSRERILEQLGVGWILERQLKDGDVVLFNRQPSLHRISMMAHYVRVLPGKTFRINPIVTPPYNADFDGDEMNLHVLQTEESRVEAMEIMDAKKHVLSARHGRAIIKHSEDAVTGVYFLSRQDTLLTKEEAIRVISNAGLKELPEPNKDGLYTGRSLLELLIPENFSVEANTKIGGKLKIKKGKIVDGVIDGKSLDDVIRLMFVKYGEEITQKFIDGSFRMGIEYLTLQGITVSYRNYYVDEKVRKEIRKVLEEMDKEIANYILQYKNKTLPRAPGMTLKQTLESKILEATTKARNRIGEILEKAFGEDNSSIIMAKIGSRGSLLNVIQMSGAVGQQVIRNKRPWRGYYKRVLPFFERGKLTARERGFVYHSFTEGLEVDEFYFHAMAGRESIVNTAIRTSRSGYMQRRLINALQDFVVRDDYSVRDAASKLVQFVYGGDAKDPTFATYKEEKEFDDSRKDDIDTV
ncbi:MAG: DNA-directed RNA polymerase subunit A' [Candidatus Micrarchaeota archaeon]|nr:DNA-directed RNA polymerase subunit A' [Candidatus Micrarchaeota archaeon]